MDKLVAVILFCTSIIIAALCIRLREAELGILEMEYKLYQLQRDSCSKDDQERIKNVLQEVKDELRTDREQLSAYLPLINRTGLSYNYFDQIAQTYCQGRFVPGWVFAVRRDCRGVAPTCNDICATAKSDILATIEFQRNNIACFDGISIKKDHVKLADNPTGSEPDAGKVSLSTYGYGDVGCTWTPNHCGPNYCCCKAY